MLKDADFNYFPAVYVVCGYTDLRCGIDSLAAIIERKYKVNLFVPNTLFLFCGRSSTRIKGLLWEGDGFLLLYKRVEQGHFAWPRSSDELKQLRPEQFKWLMQGFNSLCKTEIFTLLFFHMFLWVLCTAYHDHYAIFTVMTGSTRHFSFYFYLL